MLIIISGNMRGYGTIELLANNLLCEEFYIILLLFESLRDSDTFDYFPRNHNRQMRCDEKKCLETYTMAASQGCAGSYRWFQLFSDMSTSEDWSKVPRLTTRTLLGAPGLTTRNKDATRSKGHRY